MSENRIDRAFRLAREEGRAALILYITAGFPDTDTTRRLLPVLQEAGCDIIELGVPFSDPIADGPTIQAASTVALANGMTFQKALDLARDFRTRSQTPILAFGAYNPFLHRGLEKTAADAAACGIDGFLAADLPMEESAPFRQVLAEKDLRLVLLAAPTSSEERLRRIASSTSGFLYCIAVKGITGARADLSASVPEFLARVRSVSSIPLAVGFGISKPEHIRAVRPYCDGVIVGSALINIIEQYRQNGGSDLEDRVATYVRTLAEAVR